MTDTSPSGIEHRATRTRAGAGERARELRERTVADPPDRGGRDADDRRRAAQAHGLEPVEAEQESQDLLLTRPEAREVRLRPGRIDRAGSARSSGVADPRIDEPVGERSRAVVLPPIERHQGERATVTVGVRSSEPAHVHGRCRRHGPPDRREPGASGDRASRRPPPSRRIARSTDGPHVGGEPGPPRRVEPLDGHRQGEGAGLDPILERHVPRRDPARERRRRTRAGCRPARSGRAASGSRPPRAAGARSGASGARSSCASSHVGRSGRRGEVGRERRRRLTRRGRGSPRASHPIVQARRRARSRPGPARPDQEAPADGRS